MHRTEVTVEPACVRLQLTTTAPAAACPRWAEPASAVHSRYQRHRMDRPWGPLTVRIRLLGRTCVCRHPTCTRRICTERVPERVAPDARTPHRLLAALQAMGVALGGQAGARLAPCLGLPASRDILLRLVRRLPLPAVRPLSAMGVDAWAPRTRQRDGTIVVDVAQRRPVALLHDREAETLADWLGAHPRVTISARDRLNASRDGARAGAPQATQVADRWPRLQHLAEALDPVFSPHGKALKAVREARSRTPIIPPEGRTAMPVPPRPPTPRAQAWAAERRLRRLATDAQVGALPRQGWSTRTSAQHLGIARMPVARALQAPTVPERQGSTNPGQRVLTPDTERLLKRGNAGCREARRRVQDLQRHGETGSYPPVARSAPRLRHAQGLPPREQRSGQTRPRVVESQRRPLTTRRVTR